MPVPCHAPSSTPCVSHAVLPWMHALIHACALPCSHTSLCMHPRTLPMPSSRMCVAHAVCPQMCIPTPSSMPSVAHTVFLQLHTHVHTFVHAFAHLCTPVHPVRNGFPNRLNGKWV